MYRLSYLKLIFTIFSLLCATAAMAEKTDSLMTVDIGEVVVIAPYKEMRPLRELPLSSGKLSRQDIDAKLIHGIKDLTSVMPNIFIPDYGSKLTTAVYIRGVGSRTNTPAVGLYVDNVAYIDKSAFDFDYSDIESIEVLRGPQSTLYGRNAMGGLVKVNTRSPFRYQGTDIRIGAATYGDYKLSLTHYHRISERFAFSAGGFYNNKGGFFENSYDDNRKLDSSSGGGGRIHAFFIPSDNLKIDANVNYEYIDQGGYPYYYTGSVDGDEQYPDLVGKISYNDKSGYRRGLLNAGLNIEYLARNFRAGFITGYQHLDDCMDMDQDFSPRDIFTLQQKQRSNTVSEEVVLKSLPGKQWEWTTGAFGFYQSLRTDGPVHFKKEGIQTLIEDNANSAFPTSDAAPSMQLTIHNDDLPISGLFFTPQFNLAVYHQSTWHLPFAPGLSLTAGLRLDYEKMWLDYDSSAELNFGFSFSYGSFMNYEDPDMQTVSALKGKMNDDYVQLLPRFSVQYEWGRGNNVYATIARGYRSGGYNIQSFSDLVQSNFINGMKEAMMESEALSSIASMVGQMMPESEIDVDATVHYRPEYTWSHEVGVHLTLPDGRLQFDGAVFIMNTRDQQLSQFSENGLGRVTVNAGRSRSVGAEATLRYVPVRGLTLDAAYGYTHATFRDYTTIDSDDNEIDYRGNVVPFTPVHTFTSGGQYVWQLKRQKVFDRIGFDVHYNALGRIYWTEDNSQSQPFYGTLNARLSMEKGKGAISLWARNLLNKDYTTFYFESLSNGFMQKGSPFQAGIEIRCTF